MTQATDFSVPRIGPATPTVMAGRIDDSFDSLLSSHSGSTRPSYAVEGTFWLSTATAGFDKYYFFDGANDHLFLTIDKTTGTLTYSDPVFALSAAPTKKFALDSSLVTAGQTRTLRIPDTDASLSIWEPIGPGSYTLTAAAALSITNLSAYEIVRIYGYLESSVAAGIFLRTSSNNGGSYDSGASDYGYQLLNASGTSVSGASLSTANAMIITGSTDAGANNGVNFCMELYNFNKAKYCRYKGHSLYVSAGAFSETILGGSRAQATARNALQILGNSSTLTGRVTVEGMR